MTAMSDQTTEIKSVRLANEIATRSLRVEPEPTILLASGIRSRYYVDCRLVLSDPQVRQWVGELVLSRLGDLRFDAVGGLVYGAIPVAHAVSDAAFRMRGDRVRAFAIRKEPKA